MHEMKKDSGMSVLIGFVMVLALIVLVIAVWAALGIPGQVEENTYAHSFVLENSLADYQTSIHSMYRLNRDGTPMTNVTYSVQVPVGSRHVWGTLDTVHDVGKLTVESIGSSFTAEIDRLCVSLSDGSIVAYEGGGVYRKDGLGASWFVPPAFMIDSLDRLVIAVTSLDGDAAIGSNGVVMLNTKYVGCQAADNAVDSTVHIRYETDDEWNQKLWYSLMYEFAATYSKFFEEVPSGQTIMNPYRNPVPDSNGKYVVTMKMTQVSTDRSCIVNPRYIVSVE